MPLPPTYCASRCCPAVELLEYAQRSILPPVDAGADNRAPGARFSPVGGRWRGEPRVSRSILPGGWALERRTARFALDSSRWAAASRLASLADVHRGRLVVFGADVIDASRPDAIVVRVAVTHLAGLAGAAAAAVAPDVAAVAGAAAAVAAAAAAAVAAARGARRRLADVHRAGLAVFGAVLAVFAGAVAADRVGLPQGQRVPLVSRRATRGSGGRRSGGGTGARPAA